jgi:hypothetical protein
MSPDVTGQGWLRDLAVVAGLVTSGQVLLQVVGRLRPASVRYPGPWRPTATGDTGVYLSAAADLPTLPAHHVTKLVYLGLVRIDAALGLAGWGLLGLQMLLLGLAALVLLRHVGSRWGRRAGVLSAAVLVLNPNVAQWSKTIFVEPVFIPLMVILVVVLAIAVKDRRSAPGAVALGLLSIVVRPNGIGAALGASAVLATTLRRARLASFVAATAVLGAVAVLSPAFQSPGGDENTLAARTYEGLVIWVEPDPVRIAMPEPVDPTDLRNVAVIGYAAQHPVAVLRLAGHRVLAEVTQVRAHYPVLVNRIVAVQMAGYFLLAAIGLRLTFRDPLTRSILAVSVGLLLVIAGTWAIAEGRFGWAMFATWSPWVGIGADAAWSSAKGRVHRPTVRQH